ncbi:MAG: cation transporting ATPase C-terminal domain-containing protein, partial [Acidimicrobiia bacterium]
TAVQLLWVNLIMDSLAALALALEPPTDSLFDQPPHGRSEPLISRSMWISVMSVGAYMLAVLLVILLTGVLVDQDLPDRYRNTFLFNTFVWLQIFNELNSRSVRFYRSPFVGVFKSKSFLGVFGAIAIIQVIVVEFGGSVFSTGDGLSGSDWLKSVAIGATVLVVSAIVRAIGRTTELGKPHTVRG